MSQPDYSQITEASGLQATQEQFERLYHRYHFAKQFCENKDVVEVACGSGIGLGYLASFSKSVTGGDIDDKNLSLAKEKILTHPQIKVEKIDAHQMALPDSSCDTVLFYEAIYYLQQPEKFISESKRVLRDEGTLIICSVNKDWSDFHPSPFTHHYYSIPELVGMLGKEFNDVKVFGAFKVEEGTKASVFSFIKRLALKLDLIPGSLKLRAYLKRIFIGKTFPLPAQLTDGATAYNPPVELSLTEINSSYKIIYFVAGENITRVAEQNHFVKQQDDSLPHHRISIIIPCRNEEKYIEKCIESILAFDVPADAIIKEIFLIDGASTDKTRELITKLSHHDNRIILLDNPQQLQSFALNAGIKKATGNWIMRLDAHSHYPKNYVKQLIETAERSDADNVGGIVETLPGGTGMQAVIVQALTTHIFGVGNSGFRTGAKEGESDTVPFGFFKREIFEKVGYFDERLARTQDYEMNMRIKNFGGKIWLNPSIQLSYYNQPDMRSFMRKQFFREAPYNAYMWYVAPYTFTYRHAITAIFSAGVVLGFFLALVSKIFFAIYFSVLALYVLLAVVSSVQQAVRYKKLFLLFFLPPCFFIYHFFHGIGIWVGVLKLLTKTSPVQKR